MPCVVREFAEGDKRTFPIWKPCLLTLMMWWQIFSRDGSWICQGLVPTPSARFSAVFSTQQLPVGCEAFGHVCSHVWSSFEELPACSTTEHPPPAFRKIWISSPWALISFWCAGSAYCYHCFLGPRAVLSTWNFCRISYPSAWASGFTQKGLLNVCLSFGVWLLGCFHVLWRSTGGRYMLKQFSKSACE